MTPPSASATPSVTLFMPVLNEIEGMRVILPQVRRDWCDQILLVDGGSTDGSVEFARAQGCDTYVQRCRGIRHAYLEAWPLIRGDIVITFSPDGNCLPEAIGQLREKMLEGYDMVIASRYFGGLKSADDDAVTRFGNWLFTTTINQLHGGRYTDAMGIFRAYRTALFYELDLHLDASYATEKLCRTIMGVEPLLSIRCAKHRRKVAEIPAAEPARVGGERKLQVVRWGSAYMLQTFRELYYHRHDGT